MNSFFKITLLAWLSAVSMTNAASGSVPQNSDEVLVVEFTQVQTLLGQNSDSSGTEYSITGEVKAVHKTKLGFVAGDTVDFEFLHGATFAPVPSEGSCVLVDLNDNGATSKDDSLSLDGTMSTVNHNECSSSTGSNYDEYLLVDVRSVSPMLGQTTGTPMYNIEADVFGVKMTTLGFGKGNYLNIQTTHCATCSPLPATNWCGWAKLKDGSATSPDNEPTLELVMFENQVDASQCSFHVRKQRKLIRGNGLVL